MSHPVTSLQAALESNMVAEVNAWMMAYATASPGASATDMLRDLATVLVAVHLDVARAQVNAPAAIAGTGRKAECSDVEIMARVTRPLMIGAVSRTVAVLSAPGEAG
jgi:hypothetical protein